MATKILKSVKGRVARFTRLDSCGAKVVGTCSSIVTDGFIQVVFSAEIEAGQDLSQKNAWGDFCQAERDGDRIKWTNVKINMCEVNPDVIDVIGGETITPIVGASTTTIGYFVGGLVNTSAFAIEVWTKAAGQDACVGGTVEWGYFVAPFIKNGRIDGDVAIENGPLTIGLVGEAQQAVASWGVNPYADNPLITAGGFAATNYYATVKTTVQPPAVTVGCVALA